MSYLMETLEYQNITTDIAKTVVQSSTAELRARLTFFSRFLS